MCPWGGAMEINNYYCICIHLAFLLLPCNIWLFFNDKWDWLFHPEVSGSSVINVQIPGGKANLAALKMSKYAGLLSWLHRSIFDFEELYRFRPEIKMILCICESKMCRTGTDCGRDISWIFEKKQVVWYCWVIGPPIPKSQNWVMEIWVTR